MGEPNERMTTEEYKEQLLSRVRENYMPNVVKGYKKAHGIPLTGRKNDDPENRVKNACMEWLALHKVFHYRTNNLPTTRVIGGRVIRQPVHRRGIPDCHVVIGGRWIGLEFKSDVGRQSDDQSTFQRDVEEAGGLYLVVRGIDDLEAHIKPLLQ